MGKNYYLENINLMLAYYHFVGIDTPVDYEKGIKAMFKNKSKERLIHFSFVKEFFDTKDGQLIILKVLREKNIQIPQEYMYEYEIR